MKLFSLLLLLSIHLTAGDLYFTGKVTDSESNSPLPSANILIYHLPDSTLKGTTTDLNGSFISDNLKPGTYAIEISFIGYKSYSADYTLSAKPLDIGIIKLKPTNINTEEVTVIGKLPIAVQSGDTTIFNANGFKVNKDAVVGDLLKKVPGVQVEGGKLKAQGEEVKKIYVDGKSYMGDDPSIAIKNLPADIIDRIQVFDQPSEQSQFTGFNDGNTTKAINLITRMKVHEAVFGKFFGGYGTEKRYSGGESFNYFKNDQRVSVIGQMNNVNEQDFSNLDMLGVMGEQGGDGQGRYRNRGNDNYSSGKNGEAITRAAGINYTDKYFGSLESGSSYFYNNSDNHTTSALNRRYLNTVNGNGYKETSDYNSKNINHRFNLFMNYDPDSLNSLRFFPGVSFQKNNSLSVTEAITNSNDGPVNYSTSKNNSDLSAVNFNSLLMYRHKFNSEGRTISLALNNSYRENKGNRTLKASGFNLVDQFSDILNNGYFVQSDLVYTEPLGTSSMILINGSFSTSKDRNDKETYNYLTSTHNYSLFDTSLSNVYEKRYFTRSAGAGIRYRQSKIVLNVNLNYNIATLKSEQEYPQKFSLQKDFYSLLPSLRMQYRISSDKNLNIFYRTNTNTPTATQLQDVVDNSNPLQLTTGNPNLKQEYSHSASMRLSTTNFSNMHTFFVALNGTFKNNHIGTSTIVARRDTMLVNGSLLDAGSQLTYPENYDGFMNLNTFMTYGLPVDLISSTMNFNLTATYSKTPGALNGIFNNAKNINLGLGAVLSSNISTDIDFTVSSTSSLNRIRNSSSSINNDDYFSQATSFKLFVLAFERLTMQTDLTHRYAEGLERPSSYLLNLNLGLKIFENKKGELRFSVYDLLNQNNNDSRQITDIYTQEYSSNSLSRYFLLTFIYNLNTFE